MEESTKFNYQQLQKNLWIAYTILGDENGSQNDFQIDRDLVYAFGKTEEKSIESLVTLLLQKGAIDP